MNTDDKAIIKFDDAGNLDLYGHNEVLAKVFQSSERVLSFRTTLSDFKTFARCCPEMVTLINELLPNMPQYVADLPAATLKLMEEGKLFLRPDKDGKLLATLINSDSQKIDRLVRLKEVQQAPAVNDMMFSLSFMAITQQLNEIQESIAELRQAQIHDRETYGMVAAQKLRWALDESNEDKRRSLCSDAHDDAMMGFFGCLNTVEETAAFFLAQPSSSSLGEAIAQQIAPWNWTKTFRALSQMQPMARDFQRSIAKATYCTQYASASSFMLDDKTQAIRDLEMYAEHMSRTILGKKADQLRPWLSPKTMDALPIPKKALPIQRNDDVDILSYVETTVSRIEEAAESAKALPAEETEDSDTVSKLPEE